MTLKEKLNQQQVTEYYRMMLLIRRFEDRAAQAYMMGKVRGFLHLYSGEEAIAVGVMSVLQPDDYVVTHYRDHGQALARGMEPKVAMAELFGKATGSSQGKGGSMHLFDASINFMGGYAIVGGQFPLATGFALASSYKGTDQVTVCFFGDGALNEGEFHEAMNLASVWKLPVLFLLENNLYGMGTRVNRTYAGGHDVYKASVHYAMEAGMVDGMDVLAVRDSVSDAVDYIRFLGQRHPSKQRMWVAPCGVAGDHEMVRQAIAATYGMIEMIDDRVGQILAAIERLDQTRDTIIVFTSDHGDMMGDHSLMLKGYIHYRGTLQVPMVIADPQRHPARTNSLAGSLDLGQTLLEMAGIGEYDGMQGKSLVPVLDDPTAEVRDHVLIEDDLPHAAAARARTPAKTRTLVTADMRYTRHSDGQDQLFDLVADPDETTHIGGTDPVRRAAMIERLADALIEVDDDARGTPLAPARS